MQEKRPVLSGLFSMVGAEGLDLPSAGPKLSYLKHSFKSERFPCELPLAVLTPALGCREFKPRQSFTKQKYHH